jgi:hypothetical protein
MWGLSGAGMMRSSAGTSEKDTKDPEDLKKHGKKVYDYMRLDISRVRMLINWQTAGGLSYVCATHHRAAMAFLKFGNKEHEGKCKPEVSLLEFLDAIVSRHHITRVAAADCLNDDFKPSQKRSRVEAKTEANK